MQSPRARARRSQHRKTQTQDPKTKPKARTETTTRNRTGTRQREGKGQLPFRPSRSKQRALAKTLWFGRPAQGTAFAKPDRPCAHDAAEQAMRGTRISAASARKCRSRGRGRWAQSCPRRAARGERSARSKVGGKGSVVSGAPRAHLRLRVALSHRRPAAGGCGQGSRFAAPRHPGAGRTRCSRLQLLSLAALALRASLAIAPPAQPLRGGRRALCRVLASCPSRGRSHRPQRACRLCSRRSHSADRFLRCRSRAQPLRGGRRALRRVLASCPSRGRSHRSQRAHRHCPRCSRSAVRF